MPAIFLGIISRGRLPNSKKEVGVDLAELPLGPLGVVGRWMVDMFGGATNPDVPGTTLPSQVGKVIGTAGRLLTKDYSTRQARAKDQRQLIKGGLSTTAATVGTKYLPSMAEIRMMTGVYDLATGQTDDPRRLLYSDWTLNKGKEDLASQRGR
jgi:hypothetical protein